MISDNDLFEAMHEARGDSQVAFVKIEQKLRAALHKGLDLLEDEASLDALNAYYLQYMNDTIGAAIFLEIPAINEWQIPATDVDHVIRPEYQNFTMLVDRLVMHVRLAQVEHIVKYAVHLSTEDKTKIRHYCQQIKGVLDSAEIPVAKKDALFARLNAFLEEVDRTRTRLEVVGDFIIGCANIAGISAEKMEPVRKWLDSISRILGRAQEEEPKRLPPPQTKRLPPPQTKLPPPTKKRRGDLDDDIPF